jgi:hypothetical protein
VSRVRAAVVIAGEFIAFAPIVEAGSIDFASPKTASRSGAPLRVD